MSSFRPGGMSDSEWSSDDDDFNFSGPLKPPPLSNNGQAPEREVIVDTQEARLTRLQFAAVNDIRHGVESFDSIDAALEGGVSIDELYSDKGWSFLHFACQEANPKLISYLIEKGANVNQTCRRDGFPPFLALLTSLKIDNILLIKECLEVLVANGATLSLSEHRGMNAVMFAAKDNSVQLVELFLSFGLDVNHQDYDGITALHIAAERGHGKVIRCLLEHGAKVDLVSEDGLTAYDSAASRKFYQLASDLYHVQVTKWIPGGDPNLLNAIKDPDPTKIETNKQQLLRPQKAIIEMTLERIGLSDLIPIFNNHKIDFLAFLRLTDNDLQSIGVKKLGTRRKILDTVRIMHNAEWNKTSVHSMFLQGNITSPEVVCMLNDIKTHLDFMTQSMTYLFKRLKAEPTALISGSECARAPELARYTLATIASSEALITEAQGLTKYFHEFESRTDLMLGDLIDNKPKSKMKRIIPVAFFISVLLVTVKFRYFNH